MKKLLITLLMVVVSGGAYAQTLVETGYLRNASGQPISSIYQMKFKIFQQPSGGASIWDSGYLTVSVNDGLYTVRLGSPGQPTLDQSIFSSPSDYYMGFEVDGDIFPTRELIAYHARAIQSDFSLRSATSDVSLTSNFALQSVTSNYSLFTSFSVSSDIALTSNYSLTSNFSNFANTANTAITSNFSWFANYSLSSDIAITSNYSSIAGIALLLGGKSELALWVGTSNYAITSNYSGLAGNALLLGGKVETALWVGSANIAISSNYANLANMANVAITSNFALTANLSLTSNYAITSNYASLAGNALLLGGKTETALWVGTANIAITSNYANLANTANVASTANVALSSNFSLTANLSLTANYAITSNYSSLAGDSFLLSGQAGGYYQNASNIISGTLSINRLSVVVVTDNFFSNVSINGEIRATRYYGDATFLTGVPGFPGLSASDLVTKDYSGNVTINGVVLASLFVGDLSGTANNAITANVAFEARAIRHNSLYIINSSRSLLLTDSFSLVDATVGDITINLPNPNTASYRTYQIKKIDGSSHEVIVVGFSGEMIEGLSSYRLTTKDEFIILTSDGSNWLISGND